MPSRLHRSLTVTSRRNPSSTIRIFSSGVYLRRVAVLTLRTKDLVSSVRSSAPSALGVSVWDIFAPLSEVLYLIQGADPTSDLSAFPTSFCVPLSLTIYTLAMNEEFKVLYDEFWPSAMREDMDVVLYTQILYFSRGMGKIESKISFDRPVRRIAAYWYDLGSKTCEAESVQPIAQSGTGPDLVDYHWSIQNPANGRLYFVVYEH